MIAWLAFAAAAAAPNGSWITQDGHARVTVAPCGSSICGRVAEVLARGPDIPQTDVHNPNPALRSRPLVGLSVLGGFTWSGREWTNGHIYDPQSGKTYRSKLKIAPDGSLDVSGCVLFVCESQRWRPAR